MALLSFKNIKGDFFGGITAAIVALPLALAFGIQAFSGMDTPFAGSIGALAGLTGAIMLGFFASLFGGTHSQISGPTGPMTVVAASLVSASWAQSADIGSVLVSMSLAALLCGLFQILFGVIRIGKYIRYIPYPVLSGFMSGIGVIIILQQLYPLLGLKASGSMTDLIIKFPQTVSQGVSYQVVNRYNNVFPEDNKESSLNLSCPCDSYRYIRYLQDAGFLDHRSDTVWIAVTFVFKGRNRHKQFGLGGDNQGFRDTGTYPCGIGKYRYFAYLRCCGQYYQDQT